MKPSAITEGYGKGRKGLDAYCHDCTYTRSYSFTELNPSSVPV